MFRAGKLADLEEIRETALATIVGKMQCHARIAIMKLDVYNAKKAEKKAFSCLQRNIRMYYACKDWVWYKYYTMVKKESEGIIARQKEAERRKMMEAGLAVIQEKLDSAVAEREAVEAVHAERYQAKAGLAGAIEAMGEVAAAEVAEIKAGEEAVSEGNKKYDALKKKSASEIAALKEELAKSAAEMTDLRDATANQLKNMKDKYANALEAAQNQRRAAITSETTKQEGKSEVQKMEEEITKLVRLGTALRRDRKEQFARIGTNGQMHWIHGRLLTLLEG